MKRALKSQRITELRQQAEKKEVLVSEHSKDVDFGLMTVLAYTAHLDNLHEIYRTTKDEAEVFDKELSLLKDLAAIRTRLLGYARNFISLASRGREPVCEQLLGFRLFGPIMIRLGGKELNQAFLSNYYLSDVAFVSEGIFPVNLKIPPLFLADYRGCKALIGINIKLKSEELRSYAQIHKKMPEIEQQLQFYERVLNVKTEPPSSTPGTVYRPLCAQQMFYPIRHGTLLLLNIDTLFPVDPRSQLEQCDLTAQLRPQIIGAFRAHLEGSHDAGDPQLLIQALMESAQPAEFKVREDAKLVRVVKLMDERTNRILDRLEDGKMIFVDSFSIKQALSEEGVNLRYLFLRAQVSRYSHAGTCTKSTTTPPSSTFAKCSQLRQSPGSSKQCSGSLSAPCKPLQK